MNLFDYNGDGDQDGAGQTAQALQAWSFSDAECSEVREYAAERRYVPGASIVALGAEVDALHFILGGTVALAACGRLWRQGAGTAFGITAFLTAASQPLEAVAEEPVVLLVLPRAGLEQIWSWKPRIATALVRGLASYTAQRLQSAAIIL